MTAITLEHPAPGVASISTGSAGRRLTYRCDPSTHCVTATDDFGRVVLTIGGRGRGAGQLDTPLDVVLVQPLARGHTAPDGGPDAVWLAVADYGNRRIAVFDLDGVPVGRLELPGQDGPGAPCGLAWRAPVLEIEGIEGTRTPVLLSAALVCGTEAPPVEPGRPHAWAAASDAVN